MTKLEQTAKYYVEARSARNAASAKNDFMSRDMKEQELAYWADSLECEMKRTQTPFDTVRAMING